MVISEKLETFSCQGADAGIRNHFEERGLVVTHPPAGDKKTQDDVETDAIEAGAEDAELDGESDPPSVCVSFYLFSSFYCRLFTIFGEIHKFETTFTVFLKFLVT